jgi:hypothetical protein
MSNLKIGQRVAVVGGKHFGRAGVFHGILSGYPQWYRVRLDGGQVVDVAPYNVAAVKP